MAVQAGYRQLPGYSVSPVPTVRQTPPMTRRIVYSLILAAMLLLAAVWVSLPGIVEHLASSTLRHAGFEAVAVDIDSVGLAGARIGSLEMTHRDSGTRLSLHGIDADYRLRDLLRGHLDSLRVASLEVQTGPADGASGLHPAALLDLPLAGWRQMFPMRALEIGQLSVTVDDATHEFAVEASRLAEGLALRVAGRGALAGRGVEALLAGDGSWSARATGEPAAAVPELTVRGDSEGLLLNWRGDVAVLGAWLAPLVVLPTLADCRGEGSVAVTRNPLDAVAVSGRLETCGWRDRAVTNARLRARFMSSARGLASVAPARLDAAVVATPDALAESVALQAGLDIDLADAAVRLTAGSTAAAGRVALGPLKLTELRAETEETFLLGAATPPLSVAAVALDHRTDDLAVQGRRLTGHVRPGVAALRVDAAAERVEVAASGYRASLHRAEVTARVENGIAAGSYSAVLADQAPLGGTFEGVGADTARATLNVAPVQFGERLSGLERLVEGLPAGPALVAGTLGLEAVAELSGEGPRLDARVTLKDGGGALEGVVFSGADTSFDLAVLPQLSMPRAATVVVDVVDFGFVLADVSARVALLPGADKPGAKVEDFFASFLGGAVAIPTLTFSGELPLQLELVVSGIDLEQLQVSDYVSGLELDGRLSGRVPVRVGEAGAEVAGGLLVNDVPGTIRYQAGADADDGGVEILFRALRELSYDRLTVEPEYHADGTLLLKLRLEGTSAAFGAGQPVHFNVNVEQNMLSLLESVRLVNGLDDDIDRRVQAWYQQRQSTQPDPGTPQ